MTRAVTTVRIINNKSSVPPLSLNLSQTAPIYRTALAAGQLALVGSGGAGGYTYSATGLPAGLSLNTSTGAITGTPTTIGHNVITATVTDSATNTFTTTFSVDVLTRLSITAASPPDSESGVAYSYQFQIGGAIGAVTFSQSGALPTGLSFSSDSIVGTQSGSPIKSWPGAVTATDAGTGDAITMYYSFNSHPKPTPVLESITPTLNPGVVGVEYVYSFSLFYIADPVGFYISNWALSSLPAGVSASIVSSNTKQLLVSIVATTAVTGSFTVTATDTYGGVNTSSSAPLDFVAALNTAIQPQKAATNVGPSGPSVINFEFPSSGTPDVTNSGGTMTVTIPTVAGATGPIGPTGPAGANGHGSTTTTAAPTASGGNWVFTVGDTVAFNAASLPIYCSDGTNSIHGHVVNIINPTQLMVAPDSTSGTISSIANGSTFTFSGVAGTNASAYVGVTTNSGNAYTATPSPAITSYVTGQLYTAQFNAANTGAATLNISGLGAKNVYKNNAALTGGEIAAGMTLAFTYDGTQFQFTGDGGAPVFVASGASHAAGLVPDPGATAGTTRFLREDATWQVPTGGGDSGTYYAVVSDYDDFTSPSIGSFVATINSGITSGTPVLGPAGSSMQGVYTLDTGSSTNSRAGVGGARLGATLAQGMLTLGAGTLEVVWVIQTPAALSNGTDAYALLVGVSDLLVTGLSNFIFCEYTHTANSGEWTLNALVAGVSQTPANGVTAVIANTIYRIRLVISAGQVKLYVKPLGGTENLECTYTGSQPANSVALGTTALIIKSAGTSSRVLTADLWSYTYTLTSPR